MRDSRDILHIINTNKATDNRPANTFTLALSCLSCRFPSCPLLEGTSRVCAAAPLLIMLKFIWT
eukprot:Gb_12016 [translate_table: standard]